jgi:hypothetical protein
MTEKGETQSAFINALFYFATVLTHRYENGGLWPGAAPATGREPLLSGRQADHEPAALSHRALRRDGAAVMEPP